MDEEALQEETQEVVITERTAVIYTGPASVKLGLRHYGVYILPLPEYLAAMCEEYETLGSAFVELEVFAEGTGYPAEGSYEYQEL